MISICFSRSAILTGSPSHQNGMYGLHNGVHHFDSFKNVNSITKVLRDNGIMTGINILSTQYILFMFRLDKCAHVIRISMFMDRKTTKYFSNYFEFIC